MSEAFVPFVFFDEFNLRKIALTNRIVNRIVFTGTHGTGKTTLCKYVNYLLLRPDLLQRGGKHEYFEEPVRAMRDMGLPINQNAGILTQLAMSLEHMTNATYDRYIADRCIVDVYVYAKYLSTLPGSDITPQMLRFLEKMVYRFIYNFHGVVFLATSFCFEDRDVPRDDIRDTDIEFRNEINDLMVRTWLHLLKPDRKEDIAGRHGFLFTLPDQFSDRLKLVMNIITTQTNSEWGNYFNE